LIHVQRRTAVYCRDVISAIATAIYVGLGYIGVTGTAVASFAVTTATVLVTTVVSAAVSFLLTWATGGFKKPSYDDVGSNGRKFNTRDTTEPLKIIYGTAEVGINWIFNETSGLEGKQLNIIGTIGEGECDGLAKAYDKKAEFFNSLGNTVGLNDMGIGGTYTGTEDRYKVEIQTKAVPDKYRWYKNGVLQASGIDIVANTWMNLDNGMKVKFANATGHVLSSYWKFSAGDGLYLGEKLKKYYEHYTITPTGGVEYNLCPTFQFYPGTSTQLPNADIAARCPSWEDALRHTAYIALTLVWNDYAWQGIPEVRGAIKGLKVYDTRTSTTIHSTNPAMCIRDYLVKARYGLGLPTSPIDADSINDVANWCDPDQVIGTDSNNWTCIKDHVAASANRPTTGADHLIYWKQQGSSGSAWAVDTTYGSGYAFNGAIINRDKFIENFDDLMLNFRGYMTWSNGTYKLKVYDDDAAVMALSEDDWTMEEGIEINGPGIPDTPTKVKCIFISRDKNFQTDFAEWPQGSALTDDEERLLEIPLNMTDTKIQASKLAKFYYLWAQYNKTFSILAHPRTFVLEPGDMITLASSYLGWSNQKVRIVAMGLPQQGWIPLTVKEENSSIYNEIVESVSPEDEIWISSPGDNQADAPTNLMATGYDADGKTTTKNDGTVIFAWDHVSYGAAYQLQYRRKGSIYPWNEKIIRDVDNEDDRIEVTVTGFKTSTVMLPKAFDWRVRTLLKASKSQWVDGDYVTIELPEGTEPTLASFAWR
jgi:hypothetical protein